MIDKYICRICSGLMVEHPQFINWRKCNSCGFSKTEKTMINLEQYLMGRDKQFPLECTNEVKKNAQILLDKVNGLLSELNINEAKISSGWRPVAINNTVPNAAKKSAHSTGQALDILDTPTQDIAKKILENKDLLTRFDLYLESPDKTKGKYTNWVHLQTRKTASGNRVFLP